MSNLTPITQTKITACRFDYEYFDRPVDELAKIYGFDEEAIKATVIEQQWERKVNIGQIDLTDSKTLEEKADQLVKVAQSRLTIAAVFKQVENQPMMIAIEQQILAKAALIAESVDSTSKNALKTLESLTNIMSKVQERSPINITAALSEGEKGGGKGGGVNVIIQQHIGNGG